MQQQQMQMQYAEMQACLQRCHQGQIYHQYQPMAVSGPRKEAMTYHLTCPQPQLVSWRPANLNVTPQPQPQPQQQHPRQLQQFPRHTHGAARQTTTMDSTSSELQHSSLNQPFYGSPGLLAHDPLLNAGATRSYFQRQYEQFLPPTYFEDNFVTHRPEEAALYNPHQGQQQLLPGTVNMAERLHHPMPQHFDTRAAVGRHVMLNSKAAAGRHVTLSPYLPPLQTAQTHVNTSFYEPVSPEDFKSVSYPGFDDEDDEADSPTSVDTYGPFTPGASEYSSSFGTSFGTSFSGGPPELGSSFGSQESAMCETKHPVHGLGIQHSAAFGDHARVTAIDHYRGASTSLLPGGLARLEHHRMSEDHSANDIPDTASLRDISGLPFASVPSQPARRAFIVPATITREDSFSQDEDEVDRAYEERRRRDQYLLDMRDKGFSYREIKRRGKFREAESTLRGRVRVLTKDKSERVRKPEWTDHDVRLLRRVVAHYQKRVNSGTYARSRNGKLPWKLVSTRMKERGASYLFAPATCAKKWEEVVEEDEESGDE